MVLTEGSSQAGMACRVDGIDVLRRHMGGARGGVDAGVLRASGSVVRLGVVLRGCTRGQGGRSSTGGEQSKWRSYSPAAASGGNSGAARADLGEGRLGKLPGGTAELLQGPAGAEVQRGGVAAAAHELCTAERAAGGAAGAWWWSLYGRVGLWSVRRAK